jgi:predicted S18 family serine protease
MSVWNNDVDRTFSVQVQAAKDTFEANKGVPISAAPNKIMNIAGAESSITAAKSKMEQSIQTIRSTANSIAEIWSNISENTKDINQQITAAKSALAEQKTDVENAQVIAEIRKEQSAALKQKYDANLHTSWLGLWRPLAPETRTGLGVAAVAFGILALLTIIYLVAGYVAGMGASTGAAAVGGEIANASTNTFNRLIGGAMRSLRAATRKL